MCGCGVSFQFWFSVGGTWIDAWILVIFLMMGVSFVLQLLFCGAGGGWWGWVGGGFIFKLLGDNFF